MFPGSWQLSIVNVVKIQTVRAAGAGDLGILSATASIVTAVIADAAAAIKEHFVNNFSF